MKNEVQKIREAVEKLKSNLVYGACSSQVAMETRCKEEAYNEVLAILDNMQEEPVSEELLKASMEFAKYFGEWDYAIPCFQAGAKWQKEQEKETIELAEDHAMLAGRMQMKEQMMKNLWKPADGDDLPKIDREVIALIRLDGFFQIPPDEPVELTYKVVFAHRPNPDGWDGKSLTTGKVEHYTPKTYDKGGWNIPNVKYWLDVELPKEIEL